MNFNKMNTAQIVDAIRNGKIDSDTFFSFTDYLKEAEKGSNYKKDRDNFAGYLIDSQKECEILEKENKRLKEIVKKIRKLQASDTQADIFFLELKDILNTVPQKGGSQEDK